jgi:uncharacterized protein YodC (DUF2158 family)
MEEHPMSFTVGDQVRLITGGQAMTVEKIEEDTINCVWSNNGQIKREQFVAGTLEKYQPQAETVQMGPSYRARR